MYDGLRRVLPAVLVAVFASTATSRATGHEVRGTVTDEQGKAIAGALVVIADATVRSAAGPSCSPDCGKHTVTDGQGRFLLHTVHSLWLFKLHVEAAGYMPRIAHADARRPTDLEIVLLETNHPKLKTVGQVLLPDGQPAAGALVHVVTSTTIAQPSPDYDIDRSVETNSDGHFTVHSEQPLKAMNVRVVHSGTLERKQYPLSPGGHVNVVRLSPGSAITGRVLHRARPAAGIVLALTPLPSNESSATLAVFEATSDDTGRFTFQHVTPAHQYRLHTRMDSLAQRNLAAITRDVLAPAEGHSTDIGEVNLHPAHTVTGRFIVLDNKPPEANKLRVTVGRFNALDVQTVDVDAKGRFELRGVPQGAVALSIESSSYRLSEFNHSLDPRGRAALIGQVDEDVSLLVVLEHGAGPHHAPGRYVFDGLPQRHMEPITLVNLLSAPLTGVKQTASWKKTDDSSR